MHVIDSRFFPSRELRDNIALLQIHHVFVIRFNYVELCMTTNGLISRSYLEMVLQEIAQSDRTMRA